MIKHPLLAIALLLAGPTATIAEGPAAPGPSPPSLAELARQAEFVALAQVRDTDYLRRRDIPVSGSAYLRVLIRYKGDASEDLVEVYEKGLRENECYFPNPTLFEEGRRYLLFLRRDPENPERYRGLPAGCAVDVLVDEDNAYAVRVPVTGIELSDSLAGIARPMQFSDPYAMVDDAALPSALRDAMQAAGQIVPYATVSTDSGPGRAGLPRPATEPPLRWRYTQGVSLGDFRELMSLDSP